MIFQSSKPTLSSRGSTSSLPPSYESAVNGNEALASRPPSFLTRSRAATISLNSDNSEMEDSFSRLSSVDEINRAFEPLILDCQGLSLDAGFPNSMPSFLDIEGRDVSAEDWDKFLGHLRHCVQFSKGEKTRVVMLPLAVDLVAPGAGFCVRKFMARGMKEKKAIAVLDQWNTYFFRPRGLDVGLVRCDFRLDGKKNKTKVTNKELSPSASLKSNSNFSPDLKGKRPSHEPERAEQPFVPGLKAKNFSGQLKELCVDHHEKVQALVTSAVAAGRPVDAEALTKLSKDLHGKKMALMERNKVYQLVIAPLKC